MNSPSKKLSPAMKEVIEKMRSQNEYAVFYDTRNSRWIVDGSFQDDDTMKSLLREALIVHETGEGHLRYYSLTELGKTIQL